MKELANILVCCVVAAALGELLVDAAQFYHRCRGQERIRGFFWALSAFCDICFVTTSGLELYVLLESRRGLKLVDSRKV